MNNPLVEALAQMNLEPGRVYHYQVNGRQVQVRVLEDIPPEMMPAPMVESDVMLDAWVELPPPSGGKRLVARPAKMPPPDVPEIPRDGEES